MKKIGILIVAYGLGSQSAENSFADFCVLAKRKFQPLTIRHAFTSDKSRDRLAQEGKKSDSVIKALKKMVFEKYTHIYIQSLHLIPGIEYKNLIRAVKKIMNEHPVFIRVAKPLLQEEAYYNDMVQALARNLISLEQNKENADKVALVYMAHGTKNCKKAAVPQSYDDLRENEYISETSLDELSANALYVRFAKALQEFDDRIFLACMKGSLTYSELAYALKQQEVEKISLFPFLSLVGSHTLDDMAGEEDNSWKSLLIKDGFKCDAHCISLLQTNEFVSFWLQSLENLITTYENEN